MTARPTLNPATPVERARKDDARRKAAVTIDLLTPTQLAVLGAIAKYPKGTRVTAKLIGYELDIPESAAQQRLIRMQKVGLVKRGGWEIARKVRP